MSKIVINKIHSLEKTVIEKEKEIQKLKHMLYRAHMEHSKDGKLDVFIGLCNYKGGFNYNESNQIILINKQHEVDKV